MLSSMTGFATSKGQHDAYIWSYELRSVNAKGLDVRVRAPDWVPGLEAALRARLGKAMARGSVTLNLRVSREDTGGTLQVNPGQLDAVLNAVAAVETAAIETGLSLTPASAADILGHRGVLEQASSDEDTTGLLAALMADAEPLLDAFLEMRAAEGRALHGIIAAQTGQIETLTKAAAALGDARSADTARAMRDALARVTENATGIDPDRIAQELAMIAIKSDVTEEIDRLHAHVAAAHGLLGSDGPVGRKLDFLTQEFNREANTLCSKAQFPDLTRIGLDLKAVIDQLREQVQNVE